MVAVYQNRVKSDGHRQSGTLTLCRIYDSEEVPDNLEERVQNWANTLEERFYIEDYREGCRHTNIHPQEKEGEK